MTVIEPLLQAAEKNGFDGKCEDSNTGHGLRGAVTLPNLSLTKIGPGESPINSWREPL